MIEAEKERKSATAALDNVERQVKSQQKLFHNAEDQLAASKEQIVALKKKLEEVEKAKDQAKKAKEEVEKAWEQAEQEGYDIGVAETEEALKAEVSGVCRTYCAQVWDEALNQVGVEASSVLRNAESVYYPQAIHAPSSSSSKIDTPLEVANLEKNNPNKVPLPPGSPPKVAEQPGANEERVKVTKEVAPDTIMPPAAPRILPKTRRPPGRRLFLQAFQFLPRVTLKEQTNDLQRL